MCACICALCLKRVRATVCPCQLEFWCCILRLHLCMRCRSNLVKCVWKYQAKVWIFISSVSGASASGAGGGLFTAAAHDLKAF